MTNLFPLRASDSEGGYTIVELHGKKALVAIIVMIVLVLGFGWYRHTQATKDTDELAELLHTWLLAESVRHNQPFMDNIQQPGAHPALVEASAEQLSKGLDVEITSLGVRGTLVGTMAVRVEYTVDGNTPPDGRPVRYYTVPYSFVTGWTTSELYDSWPWVYNTAIWR